MGWLRPLPRRWPNLPHEQCRGTKPERAGLGRKAWLFAGSDRGAERAAVIYSLIGTAKLNDIDPQAWLADVLMRIADAPQNRLQELLPWNWRPERDAHLKAA